MNPTGRRRELARLETPEVDATERTLERLRRQLATDAKRAATDELGNAA
jgi:hypothetical protein